MSQKYSFDLDYSPPKRGGWFKPAEWENDYVVFWSDGVVKDEETDFGTFEDCAVVPVIAAMKKPGVGPVEVFRDQVIRQTVLASTMRVPGVGFGKVTRPGRAWQLDDLNLEDRTDLLRWFEANTTDGVLTSTDKVPDPQQEAF